MKDFIYLFGQPENSSAMYHNPYEVLERLGTGSSL
jgi:hypothetical protein